MVVAEKLIEWFMKTRIAFLLFLGTLGVFSEEAWAYCCFARARDFSRKDAVGCTIEFLVVHDMDFKTVGSDSSPFSPEQEKEIDGKSSGLLVFAGKTNRWEKISFLLVPPKTTTIYEDVSRRYVLKAEDIKIVENKESVPIRFFLESNTCLKRVEFTNPRRPIQMSLLARFPLTGKFCILGGFSSHSTTDVGP